MDLSNISIKQKRYSTYGWNDFDSSTGRYKNILNQGEIGILLGSNNQPVEVPNSGKILDSIITIFLNKILVKNKYFTMTQL